MDKHIVFFDLDGTILGGMSSEKSFFIYLLKKGHIGIKQFIKYWLFIIKWFPKYKLRAFVKNKSYLAGLSKDKINTLAEQFVTEKLLKNIRPELIKKIEEHRRAGDIIILLTGTPSFIAQVFAKHLNIDHVEPTHCVLENENFSHLSPTQHPYAEEKLTIAKRICQQYGIDIKNCFAYGNSIHDSILLAAVGQAIAVTPDKKLRKIAKENHWEIIE
jgi:HAD superfamily hydrolase (TIGR01490 family)